MIRRIAVLSALVVIGVWAQPAAAQMTKCHISYRLKGWSFLYKEYHGSGNVTCDNGQSARVALVSRGGGFTFGKSEIDGKGVFSQVRDIDEIFGTYAAADAHAGANAAAEGYAMTKGEVSLSLSGLGRGFDLGFAFSGFTIRRQ